MDIKIRSDEKLYMEELKSWLREESETPPLLRAKLRDRKRHPALENHSTCCLLL